jgi:hypothetical protein
MGKPFFIAVPDEIDFAQFATLLTNFVRGDDCAA